MTTIIGVENDDGVYVYADSQVTDDNGKLFSHPSMVKITERGSFLIAGAGEILPCDVIQHAWQPPRLTSRDKQDLYHFMVVKVVPSMRKILKEYGYNFDEPGESRFQFLVAVGGELFELDDDLGITKTDSGHYAIGSGAPYALGALAYGADVEEAMDIAAKLTAFTSGPYIGKTQSK
jgi:ATP-dependent protease HslVU (ClpYQ) peptidase subunit